MITLPWKRKEPPKAPLPFTGIGQKMFYGVGLLAGLTLLAPVAAFALSVVTNIAAAIVVAILIMATLMSLPALSRWWKIQVLKMLKVTAQKNPVETLQLELHSRQHALEAANQQAAVITAKRNSLKEKLEDFKSKHGSPDGALEQMSDKLSQLVDRLKASLKRAGVKLLEFEQFVDRQADRWEIAKETGELAAMLRAAQGGDITDTFLAKTAIESIRNELNTSFAELDAILDREDVRAIVYEGDASRIGEVSVLPQNDATELLPVRR